MAPSSSSYRIVRSWTNHNAPTGEGARYQTADGTVWRDVAYFNPEPATGVSYGYRSGNHIYPR